MRWAAAAAMLLAAGRARADTVATESVAGHAMRIERAADGALSLTLDGHEPVAIGSGTPRIERVSIGAGQAIVVRVEGSSAFVALVAGSGTVGPDVLFAGPTSWRGDDPGERHRSEVFVRDLDGDGHPDVVVGERREDVQLCGLGSPLVDARAIDPRTLHLARVVLNPLRADLLPTGTTAPRMIELHAVAVASPTVPIARVVNVTTRIRRGETEAGVSVLTDRSDDTAWTVARHDFATATVTLAGFDAERVILVAPPAPALLPRHFVVLTGHDAPALDVTVPAGVGTQPGARVAIPIVPARGLQCLSLIVLEGADRGAASIAEVDVVSGLDHQANPASALVERLAGAQADQAALLLGSMGDTGVAAVADALPTLPTASARAGVRMLSNQRTARAASALVAALARPELADTARAALLHMGPVALDALSSALASTPRVADLIQAVRAPLAARLRAMAPALAIERASWLSARGAVRGLVDEAAHAGQLDAWLAMMPQDVGAAARGLSIAADAAVDAPQRAAVALRARAVTATRFEDRFRLLRPLAGDPEGRAAVSQVALHDDNADLRCEAAMSLAGRGADDTLVEALRDAVPRVRAAAARGLAGVPAQRAALGSVLARDGWPSVRAEAAASLAGDSASAAALVAALDDASLVVVRAAIAALERTPGAFAPRLMTFAEDEHRNPDLRADALRIVATRCERALAQRLEALARREIDPVLPPPEQAIGHEALAALAHLEPARARAFLRGTEANAFAIAAVERAAREGCAASGSPPHSPRP